MSKPRSLRGDAPGSKALPLILHTLVLRYSTMKGNMVNLRNSNNTSLHTAWCDTAVYVTDFKLAVVTNLEGPRDFASNSGCISQ
jgi:hypothetical protein